MAINKKKFITSALLVICILTAVYSVALVAIRPSVATGETRVFNVEPKLFPACVIEAMQRAPQWKLVTAYKPAPLNVVTAQAPQDEDLKNYNISVSLDADGRAELLVVLAGQVPDQKQKREAEMLTVALNKLLKAACKPH